MRGKRSLAVVLMVMCLFTEITPAWAQGMESAQESIDAVGTDYITSANGEWSYELQNGEVFLNEYLGDVEYLDVPEQIDGYTVSGILFAVFLDNYTLKSVALPNTINSIEGGAFASAYALEEITIDETSTSSFHSVDGVLYNGKKLIAYPAAKEGATYVIPNGTELIKAYAFYGCSNLKKIIVSQSVTTIGSAAFARSTQPIDIIIKRKSYKSNYLKDACWQMKSGTRFLVADEEAKELYAAEIADGYTYNDNPLYNNNHYKDSTEPMAVEIMELVPATSLTFTDGSTEQYVTISYTDTGTTASEKNTFYLQSLYQQEPYDTTDNVTWSLQSGTKCPDSTNHACEVTSGGTIITYSGGEAVLVGKDESGHEIILHVDVYSPMESAKFLDANISVLAGEYEYDYIKITPYKSYASNVVVAWEIEDTNIATVEQNGLNGCNIYGMDVGTTTLTATINNDGTLVKETAKVSVYDYITNCTVDPIPTQTYLGEQLKPTPVVRYKGRVLTEGVDYQIVRYGDNCYAGTQVGCVYINGLNTTFLKGTTTLKARFDIVDGTSNTTTNPSINEGQVTEQPNSGTQTGDDNNNTPNNPKEITGIENSYTKVYGSKSFTLNAAGPDAVTYTSSDKKVVTVGQTSGKVTIKGIGKATITIKSGNLTKAVTITVIPKKLSSVKAKAAQKSIKVSWKKNTTVTGYQVQYATNSKFTKGKKTVTIKKNKTTSYTIKKLKSKKKYFVRVRAYKTVKGKKYYSDWSKAVSMKTK